MTKEQKTKLAEQLEDQLNAFTDRLDDVSRTQAALLIENVAFMAAELTDLRADIAEKGSVCMVTNGNGITSLTANPSVKVYNSMMKIFGQTVAQLKGVLPKEVAVGNKLLQFILAGKSDLSAEEKSAKDEEARRAIDEEMKIKKAATKPYVE